MAKIPFKVGSTFAPTITYTPPVGGLPNLIGATITSHVRQNNALMANLTPDLAMDGMSFTLTSGDTSNWGTGDALWDIRIVIGGTVYYSETVVIDVQRNVTKP